MTVLLQECSAYLIDIVDLLNVLGRLLRGMHWVAVGERLVPTQILKGAFSRRPAAIAKIQDATRPFSLK